MKKLVKESYTLSLTWLLKQSLVKTPKKLKWPKLAEIVTTIKDHKATWYLENTTDEQKYA